MDKDSKWEYTWRILLIAVFIGITATIIVNDDLAGPFDAFASSSQLSASSGNDFAGLALGPYGQPLTQGCFATDTSRNISKNGSVTYSVDGQNFCIYYDHCNSNNILMKYYCSNNTVKYTFYNCGINGCNNGRCTIALTRLCTPNTIKSGDLCQVCNLAGTAYQAKCSITQTCNPSTGSCTNTQPQSICTSGILNPNNNCQICNPQGTGYQAKCSTGQTCNPSTGTCTTACTPNCAGKTCGNNGCGGTCGTCTTPQICSTSGTCTNPVTGGGGPSGVKFRNAILLHHSVGGYIYQGVPSALSNYNSAKGLSGASVVKMDEEYFPGPSDVNNNQWSRWDDIFNGRDSYGVTMDSLYNQYPVIIVKTCYISQQTMTSSSDIAAYEDHIRNIVAVMAQHPSNYFILWTNYPGATDGMPSTSDRVGWSYVFSSWMKNSLASNNDATYKQKFGNFPSNVYIFDVYNLLASDSHQRFNTEIGGVAASYAIGGGDDHPSPQAINLVAPALVQQTFDNAINYER